jgi:hypothetical protein
MGSQTETETTSGTSAGTGTQTEGSTGGDSLCKEACALDVACDWWEDQSSCEYDCDSQLGNDDPDCVAAVIAYRQCETTTTCADHSDDCGAALNQVADTCNFSPEDECAVVVGAQTDGSACRVDLACGGQPKQVVDCDDETCTCIEGGRAVGSCDVESFCGDVGPDAQAEEVSLIVEAFVAECCGF